MAKKIKVSEKPEREVPTGALSPVGVGAKYLPEGGGESYYTEKIKKKAKKK